MRVLKVAGSLVFFFAFVFSAFVFGTRTAAAQTPHREAVRVTCSCDDAVGKAYATALRSALAESKHFREMAATEEFDQEPIRINIVSLPIGAGANGQPRTAISIVSIRDGAVTHQLIETCNRIEVESSAQSMLVSLVNWK